MKLIRITTLNNSNLPIILNFLNHLTKISTKDTAKTTLRTFNRIKTCTLLLKCTLNNKKIISNQTFVLNQWWECKILLWTCKWYKVKFLILFHLIKFNHRWGNQTWASRIICFNSDKCNLRRELPSRLISRLWQQVTSTDNKDHHNSNLLLNNKMTDPNMIIRSYPKTELEWLLNHKREYLRSNIYILNRV
jgi:hypothetical protein